MAIHGIRESLISETNQRHPDKENLATTRSAYGGYTELHRGAPNRLYGTISGLAEENLSFHWEYHANHDSEYHLSIERYWMIIENMIQGLPRATMAEIQINFRAIHRSVDEVKSDTINIARQILDAHPQVDNLEVQYSDGSVNALLIQFNLKRRCFFCCTNMVKVNTFFDINFELIIEKPENLPPSPTVAPWAPAVQQSRSPDPEGDYFL